MNYSKTIDKCPICMSVCIYSFYNFKRNKEIICERCGEFRIWLFGLSSSNINNYKNGFAIVSYYIKNFHNPEDLIDSQKINWVLENYTLPDYEKRYQNLLNWIAKESDYSTKTVKGDPNKLASLIGAVDAREVIELLDDIWGERLIEVEHPSGSSLRQFGEVLGFQVHLTVAGITKVKKNSIEILNNKRSVEYDAFISHASEDKNDFVRPLAENLIQTGLKIWYDEFQLTVGDSLRRSIDKGLSNSRFGIVVFSNSFFEKNWPQYELDGLVTKEINGRKVILPIWYKVSKTEVMNYSPSLADKYALDTTKNTIDQIVKELLKVLK